jgi:hypothetical protein
VRALRAALAPDEPCGLARHGHLEALMARAGPRVLGGAVVSCPCTYPDAETAWLAVVSSGAMQAARHAIGTERLKEAVLGALAPYRTAAGGLRWETRCRYVTATPLDGGR